MLLADYLCQDKTCDTVFEYDKPYKVEFPETLPCPKCGKPSKKSLTGGSIIIPNSFRSC